jgi:hypothetical protein
METMKLGLKTMGYKKKKSIGLEWNLRGGSLKIREKKSKDLPLTE